MKKILITGASGFVGNNLVKKIDKAWSGKNWNKLETFFYDTAKYAFAEGDKYNSFDDVAREYLDKKLKATQYVDFGV